MKQVLVQSGKARGFNENSVMVIAGLSNTYADYVTTFEEYQVCQHPPNVRTHFTCPLPPCCSQEQRYEAASTDYGPYTLDAYIQGFEKLALALATVSSVSLGAWILQG